MKEKQPISIDSLKGFIEDMRPKISSMFVLVDKHTRKHCLPMLSDFIPRQNWSEVLIGSGEGAKSMTKAMKICHELIRRNLDRNSLIINLGGGVVSDLGGFVASIMKRGVRFINIPTSLIGMVDAAIGGKTAVNSGHVKNQIGTFHFPEAIVLYVPWLKTLPQRHLKSGYAEMLKHGLIADAQYYHSLLKIAHSELANSPELIHRSIEIKNAIIKEDPYENGIRSILNVGHTVGHALESWSHRNNNQALTHGHAIAIGMAVESQISMERSILDKSIGQRIQTELLERFPLPNLGSSDIPTLLRTMKRDKKALDSKIRMPLLSGIGTVSANVELTDDVITQSLRAMFKLV